jgi:hypothetical protein
MGPTGPSRTLQQGYDAGDGIIVLDPAIGLLNIRDAYSSMVNLLSVTDYTGSTEYVTISTDALTINTDVNALDTTAWKVLGYNSNYLFKNDTNNPMGTNTLYLQSAGDYDDGGQIVFSTGSPDVLGNRRESARISPSGNMGIGTTSPQHRIDIYDTSAASMSIGTDGAKATFNVSPGELSINTNPSINVRFGGSTLLIDTLNGNVGIGTVAPRSTLHVEKNSAGEIGPILTLKNATNTLGDAAQIRFDVGGIIPNGTIDWVTGVGGDTIMIISTTKDGVLGESMRIDTSGNVGIANSAPSSRLTVGGMIESVVEGFKFPDGSIQDTSALEYKMGNVMNWTSNVYTVADALDQIAARLTALGG